MLMSVADELIKKAAAREIRFGIIGLGYVGLPLAIALANAGYKVLGFDVSHRVVDGLGPGRSHVKGVSAGQLNAIREAGRFEAPTAGSRLRDADAISIC